MRLPFPRVGGRERSAGLSILPGDNFVPPFGEGLNFKPFGQEPPTTGSKKNPSSSLYPIPSPLLLVFNPKRALSYPFWPFLKKPKSNNKGLVYNTHKVLFLYTKKRVQNENEYCP